MPGANRFREIFRSGPGRPLIVAHRGDSSSAPENTIEAAEAGWAAGADAWEIDVQLTRDGVAVVVHDPGLARTTDAPGRFRADPRAARGFAVADFDWREIQTLDAGRWFLDPEGGARSASGFGSRGRLEPVAVRRFESGEVRVPSLTEALAWTIERDWLVNVELKASFGAPDGLAEAAWAAIQTTGAADRVLVSSFDHELLARFARDHPEVAVGVLALTPPYLPAQYVRNWIGADAYHPSGRALGTASAAYRADPSPGRLRLADIEALRVFRVPFLAFAIEETLRDGPAEHLAMAGAAGLFADDPGGFLRRIAPAQPIRNAHQIPLG